MLPLPHIITEHSQPAEVQGNFDRLSQSFPLSRQHMKVETPHVVGGSGEPAFQNAWVNNGGGFTSARFWKDPMGLVHIQGVIKSGTVGAGIAIFVLPAGYRPSADLIFGTDSNGAHGRITVRAGGNVEPTVGSNVYFALSCSFKQEQ